jgi:deoxyribodipyrimidine photolyase
MILVIFSSTCWFWVLKDYTDLYDPPASIADKLGYPRPIVKHKETAERAKRRFKNPGIA